MNVPPKIAATLYPWLEQHYTQLSRQFMAKRLHHAVLISGVDGLGKSQLAQCMAELLQCGAPIDNKACGQCQSCRLHGSATHPDYYSLAPAVDKTSISIEQIRTMQASIINTGLTNAVRVVVIAQAELMTISAANALLKVLEEPPKAIYFFLTCRQRTLLPATIVSRCLAINASSAPTDKLAAWVSKQSGTVINANQLNLFNNSPLRAVAGLRNGFLDYVAALRDAMINVIIGNNLSDTPIYPLLELIKGKEKDVDFEHSVSVIHLLIIDCAKIASGITVNNSFELSTAQIATIAKVKLTKFLAFEQDLKQLKQLFNTQPSLNKLLQLQRVIVNFKTVA